LFWLYRRQHQNGNSDNVNQIIKRYVGESYNNKQAWPTEEHTEEADNENSTEPKDEKEESIVDVVNTTLADNAAEQQQQQQQQQDILAENDTDKTTEEPLQARQEEEPAEINSEGKGGVVLGWECVL